MTTAGPLDGSAPLAVTVVVSRRPAPGREADLTAWAEGITRAAEAFDGHLGAHIYPPSPPERDDLIIAFSFSDAATLSAWESSPERAHWLAKSEPLKEGAPRTHAVSGFEGIFAPSVHATSNPPPRW